MPPAPIPAPTGRRCGGRPGSNGLPAPPSSEPRLNGRNCVAAPASFVVIATRSGSTAKCTTRAPGERDVLRVAVAPVLRDRVLDALARERVLQLSCRDRNPVEEEREVDRLRLVGRVRELADEHEPVRLVARHELRRQPVRRLEVREPDLDAEVLDAVAEHVDRAALVELGREPLEEVRAARLLAAVARRELTPRVRLRRLDEREQVARIEAEHAVERARVALR